MTVWVWIGVLERENTPLLSASKKIFVKRSFQLRIPILGLRPHWKSKFGYDIKYVASLYFFHAMPSEYLRKQQTQDGRRPMV